MRARQQMQRKGMAMVLTILSMLLIIPMMGLALDGGMLFMVKARFGAAADSAALGAARSINLADTIENAGTYAEAAATKFLRANFPDSYLYTDPASVSVNPSFQMMTDNNNVPNGVLRVSVNASITAPVAFMRWAGVQNVPVSVTGTATRRVLVMSLVLDKSGSMGTRDTAVGSIPATLGTNPSACESMVFAASKFINYFSPFDYVGLVTFSSSAYNDQNPAQNFKTSIRNKISDIECGGTTNTTGAIELAEDQVMSVNNGNGFTLSENAIVLFSDGMPNGVNADFPIRRQVDTRYGRASSSPAPPNTPYGNYNNCINSFDILCNNMPVKCSMSGPQTVRGSLSQSDNFDPTGARNSSLAKTFSSDPSPSWPSGCTTNGSSMASQSLAYIPNTDRFGNSTRHQYYDNRIYQINQSCAVQPNGSTLCKKLGGTWNECSSGCGAGSNFYTSGPYQGFLRTDSPNTVGVAGMAATVNAANRIRTDPNFHIRINTIYFIGQGGDPVDKMFMPMIANVAEVPHMVFESNSVAPVANPYFNPSQSVGIFMQTADVNALTYLFAQMASSLLRLSA